MDKKELINLIEKIFDTSHVDFFNRLNLIFEDFDYNKLEKILIKINENQEEKKENGVYYTPNDVCDFITANCFANTLIRNHSVTTFENCIDEILNLPLCKIQEFLFCKTVFDPTSGCGDFLISALKIKIEILKKHYEMTYSNIEDIFLTIFGNDINDDSNKISIFRLIFIVSDYLNESERFNLIEILKENFTNFDMSINNNKNGKFDIIIGNPPYVEKGKICKYGNIYADILETSSNLSKKDGTFGFIIPISFVSTQRMSKIRSILEERFKTLFLLNYSDRPSCIFNGVHQKLTILIYNNNCDFKNIFTSKYSYWYKNERRKLFLENNFFKLKEKVLDVYPKISNLIEYNILNKVIFDNKKTIYEALNEGNDDIFLNMRSFFWMKAFTFCPGSSEYKKFRCKTEQKKYILSILNSSLFFFYWVSISDCWHITSKELKGFKIKIDKVDFTIYDNLYDNLEKKLEETKQFIGTKQTNFAYKHKFCKKEIDKIDNQLAIDFNLSFEELEIVKNFAIKYRMGINDEI